MYIDLLVHLVTTTHGQQRYSRKQANYNVDTDYDLTGPEQEGCVRGCTAFFL